MVFVFLILFASAPASYASVSKCRANETLVPCKTICPPQSCNISYTTYSCGPKPKCVAGCDCITDYLRNSEGKCVLNNDCPPPPQCGANETLVPCKTICPPQSCNISYTTYSCGPKPKCVAGCDCITDYLRNNEGKCVLNNDCPPPPGNTPTEQPATEKPPTCRPPHTHGPPKHQDGDRITASSSSSNSSRSSTSYSSSASSCSTSKPPIKGGPVRNCTYNRCTPTCSLPNPPNCPENSNPCNCPPGTKISDVGGHCVPEQECQKYINCKGDYNASYTDCPIACPSTCAKPDAEFCNTECGSFGCQCNPGYILSEKNGKCIKPEDCSGGYPCGQNETFVGCSIRCPNDYCPSDDSRAIVVCDPPRVCPSGCRCQANYKRKSVNDPTCILASDCPPVNCTRPNEEWNSCPNPCSSDSCSDRNKTRSPGDCPSSGPNCMPQCVCKEGFYRNRTEICVTARECPPDN